MPASMLVPMHRVGGPYIEALTTAITILETQRNSGTQAILIAVIWFEINSNGFEAQNTPRYHSRL